MNLKTGLAAAVGSGTLLLAGDAAAQTERTYHLANDCSGCVDPSGAAADIAAAAQAWNSVSGSLGGPSNLVNITENSGFAIRFTNSHTPGTCTYIGTGNAIHCHPNMMTGQNLTHIFMHEFGHGMGLGHSDYEDSIMYETYGSNPGQFGMTDYYYFYFVWGWNWPT